MEGQFYLASMGCILVTRVGIVRRQKTPATINLLTLEDGSSDLEADVQNLELLVGAVVETLVCFSEGEGDARLDPGGQQRI